MSDKSINLTLKIWRQKNANEIGHFETHPVKDISTDMSFLEMFDLLNLHIIKAGGVPIAFDSDCREGICGMCSMTINGNPHGPDRETATCQLHMRRFSDGDTIVVEPFRAKAFPVLKDLCTDRSSLDRMIAAGGFVSVNTGSAQDGNALPVPKQDSDLAMDAAACIGCGACVAACKNASAMLFVSAKVSHLGLLPQGAVEKERRVLNMVAQMDKEKFGSCTNTGACEAACPKAIKMENIARMNRGFFSASLTRR
ncbi:MAG TPA: succinate dehydrogenase/fumarate reductase iron-sulfur subunit [Bdellovibrionales bacterium]|nr:MAG: fumarate reductase [Bdellovibrionales bacterium GWB1_52_6]OFZ04087.1 MAG: fumarate reductase [Bdellovibrionales bacterium GWA1_52_35]OFZ41222.1 MAG: fumarate reductase [Bdellovibrionales bacterium GWC1_52_8]HAR43123.1 succinate dehydrogenase/fumarate reductase iron-sulfur subunit [Bdellovibrionales bacterium]HCM39826.1 succinate dehydrogenase/fumarate reductase iron-sulfur subunit [Bdellovibrionales bacterium]